MGNDSFKALWVESTGEKQFSQQIIDRPINSLPDHPLRVAVQYSSLNYKDALSAFGVPGVTREYPHTPGIDVAGTVIEDRSGKFKVGEEVIVCGYDLGMNTSGGLSQRIHVPSEWAVALPGNLSLRDSMVIGTAGFTAALCVQKLLRMGAKPEDGEVLVTGATGGVGTFSIAILSKLGFSIAALTGKTDQEQTLKSLGASQIVARETLSAPNPRPMAKPIWAHAVDCVGGDILSNLIKAIRYGGSVAACGLASSPNITATVLPFILRGVNLLGVDCVELPLAQKAANWQCLASEFKLDRLAEMAEEITLAQTPAYLGRFLNGQVFGRYVVNVNR
jgi:alcohol dehydrogenase